MTETITRTSRSAWISRFALGIMAVIAVLTLVEIVLRQTRIANTAVMDVVDIRTPATIAAKVRHLSEQPGRKVIMLGDSLVAGQTMLDYGDSNWRKNTISADLQQRFDNKEPGTTSVLNLGMNGVLPADLEAMVEGLLLTKPEFLVLNVSLRSFSQDFSAPEAQNSRDWLKESVVFRGNGSIVRLPNQYGPASAIEKSLLNTWTTYRLRDALRARYLDGEPKDLLQRARDGIVGKSSGAPAGPAAEMRLLLQVRSRYSNVSLDAANPQFAAWTRMLARLKAANQKTIIFYGTESPRLLPGLIDQARYGQLMERLKGSVTQIGGPLRYLGPNQELKDEVFLDHVHVNAAGNRSYGEKIFLAFELAGVPVNGKPDAIAAKPSADSQPVLENALGLQFRPFVDSLNQAPVHLGDLDDFSKSLTPEAKPDKPRFKVRGFPILTVERGGSELLRDITFLYNWWDKDGVALGVRDSHHMLRTSLVPLEEYPEDLRKVIAPNPAEYVYVDKFTGIPARVGAAEMAFFVQDSSMLLVEKAKQGLIRVYGQTLDRAWTATDSVAITRKDVPSRLAGLAPTVENELTFATISGTELASRGVQFELDGVAALYTIQVNHERLEHKQPGVYQLGAMAPQVIGYRTRDNHRRTLSFSGADLIRFNYDPSTQKLSVEAFSYDYQERTTRVSKLYPGKDGKRIHANLAFVNKLPAQKMRITHSNSEIMAFPLWQPGGALASFVVTEHADYVGVKQDTFTMFGSEKQEIVDGKGFLGNGIPLTKTIFPTGKPGPFQTRTGGSATVGPFQQSTLNTDDGFLGMLHGYRAKGFDVEVGVHCVGTNEDQKQRKTRHVAEALELMRQFKPVTWVDHGGRDCLWETGWDPTSDHYVIPLLRQHNFKYINMLGDKYDGRYNMLRDNHPSNILFYSIGIDDNLDDDWKPIVFNTVPIGFRETDFTREHVAKMVKARGLVNVHTYLPYEATIFETSPGGIAVMRAHPWYNQLLQNIAEVARTGDLHLATTRDLNDYIWKVRSLHIHSSGTVISVGNAERHSIKGLTLAYQPIPLEAETPALTATIDKASILGTKLRDGVNYAWLDLKP